MADLAKLVVRLEAQSAQLLTELEKANKKVDRFASQTSKTLQKWSNGLVGFFSGRALFNFAKDVVEAQGELVGMAEQAGTSVEQLSALGYAAEQSGSDLDGLNAGLRGLANTAADAAAGSDKAAEAFATLGISATDSNGDLKATDELLLEIAEQFEQYADGAAKSALAQDLFGKSGRELIPLLNKGRDGIEELTEKAARLGLVVSTETAQAANQLGDDLKTLSSITRGVMGEALSEVVPILDGFVQSLTKSAEESGNLDRASRALAAGFKLLLSAGNIVAEIFDRVGSAVGAAAAAVVAIAQGEFRRAFDIVRESQNDTLESVGQTASEIAAIWTEKADEVVAKAEEADQRLKKTLVFGGGGKTDAVQEVRVTAKKIEDSPVQALLKEYDQATKTSSDLAQQQYNREKEMLDLLLQQKIISIDEYNERISESFDEFLPAFEVTVDKIKETAKKADDELTEFRKEALRNTQDILADGLGDALEKGVSEGAEGALDAFVDMLTEMALQAVAADLAEKIFGTPGQAGDTGGIIGAIGSFFGFGGTRDRGGRGEPGMGYLIGKGAQPEVFFPDTPGTFVPNFAGAGGTQVSQTINVAGLANERTARQMQIAAAREQRIATARLGG